MVKAVLNAILLNARESILHTIVENYRQLGIHPKEYLTDALTRLPGMLAKDAITLTPLKLPQDTQRETGS